MSKMVTTAYTMPKKVELVPGSQSLTVTVDDSGVSAGSDGKKIVLGGTVVGGNFFADPANKVKDANTPNSLTTALAGTNNDFVLTSKVPGSLKLAITNGGATKPLEVTVVNDEIRVQAATDGSSVISSTANLVIAAINNSAVASQLVAASLAAANDGTGLVTILAATALSGGAAVAPEGVLLYDVDVTYGPAAGAMIINGIVDANKIAVQPSELAKKVLAGRIVWAK